MHICRLLARCFVLRKFWCCFLWDLNEWQFFNELITWKNQKQIIHDTIWIRLAETKQERLNSIFYLYCWKGWDKINMPAGDSELTSSKCYSVIFNKSQFSFMDAYHSLLKRRRLTIYREPYAHTFDACHNFYDITRCQAMLHVARYYHPVARASYSRRKTWFFNCFMAIGYKYFTWNYMNKYKELISTLILLRPSWDQWIQLISHSALRMISLDE